METITTETLHRMSYIPNTIISIIEKVLIVKVFGITIFKRATLDDSLTLQQRAFLHNGRIGQLINFKETRLL